MTRYNSMNSLLKCIVLALALLLFFATPIHCTSRKLFLNDQVKPTETGFRVTLKHVDHGSNYTKLEQIQRGIYRARSRLNRLNAKVTASSTGLESRVYQGDGDFLMDVAIGTPPNSFTAIMDTGSDLIWTQCKPCEVCYNQPTPIFDPSTSSTFSKLNCSSNICQDFRDSLCDNDDLSPCEYKYGYEDLSFSQGVLSSETFTFQSGPGSEKVSVPNITFGCGTDNEGFGEYDSTGLNEGSGLVGMGRGPLSLVSQLDVRKFSYCLNLVGGNTTSTLLMGSLADTNIKSSSKIMTTPLVHNPSEPSDYYITLEGITVGSTRLPISKKTFAINKDGSGGMVIDSGTTFTYLEEKAFNLVKEEFISQIDLPVAHASDLDEIGLELCFQRPQHPSSLKVPKLIFHFKGADLELPIENYMITNIPDLPVICLAMGSSDGLSLFGNIQQQNLMVVYDIGKESLSFIPTQCTTL